MKTSGNCYSLKSAIECELAQINKNSSDCRGSFEVCCFISTNYCIGLITIRNKNNAQNSGHNSWNVNFEKISNQI